ncbi:hypothetical protein KUV26_02815 [Leisingera daeponensis]|uniref:Uncharacterized protein n=1 Tax=Leisingera daeponensis TaxID=405746 RepID=A0ABS7NAY3_9RHOB|nr:hypothetical protein [Leisingera daeponensis]MBY6138358.1 hypothetical protein [Leisingera daeponensis]
MNTAFSEAFTKISTRIPHAVRDFEILRVTAQLEGEDYAASAEASRKEALKWAKKRAGRALPKAAWELQDFDLLVGGRSSTAVRIENDALDLWALRAEDPDKDIAGRIWSTEIVIGGEVGSRPHVSLRLIVSTTEPDFAVEPHVPGPVLQMIETPGLIRGARRLTSKPVTIQTENDAEDLCDHLEDPERRLPIFVAALPDGGGKLQFNAAVLAKAVAGLARIVLVPAELTWVLTERFGKYRSVFNGGVRAYLRGFSATDDPFRHRLFLEADLRKVGGGATCVRSLRALAAEVSISETRLGKDVLDFASVRTASRKLRKTDLSNQAAPDDEVLKTAEELVESLEKQIEEKDKEIDGYIAEVEAVEDRAQAAEQENRSLLFRVRQLQAALAEGGEVPTEEPPLPQVWSEFTDWLDQTYPDKVLLTPAARRMARSPEFEDVTLVARAIAWLATVQHDRRINGGGSLRDVPVENGILNSPCGGDTYSTDWKGRRYEVDWHVKNGGNVRDPKRCLRIYYFWEPETQQTVIDHLPAHRRTSAT